ncbi:MAG: hypothetical protein V1776_05190 [Candidatus Diapherotrites archaeon]
MVTNIFVRAGIFTVIVLIAWFLLSTALEGERNTLLLGKIDTVIAEESAVGAYLDYLESTGNVERYCHVLEEHIQIQNERLFSLLALLDEARQNSLQNQYPVVRQRFQSANARLFFSLQTYNYKCPATDQLKQPILYFFPDNMPCSDCLLQAQILDEIRDTCSTPIQIFAFPVEGGIETVELLVKDYGIETTPSLVINNEVLKGVQSKGGLMQLLNC